MNAAKHILAWGLVVGLCFCSISLADETTEARTEIVSFEDQNSHVHLEWTSYTKDAARYRIDIARPR